MTGIDRPDWDGSGDPSVGLSTEKSTGSHPDWPLPEPGEPQDKTKTGGSIASAGCTAAPQPSKMGNAMTIEGTVERLPLMGHSLRVAASKHGPGIRPAVVVRSWTS